MVVSVSGICLSQKRIPHMCLIRPSIDLQKRVLILSRIGTVIVERSFIIPFAAWHFLELFELIHGNIVTSVNIEIFRRIALEFNLFVCNDCNFSLLYMVISLIRLS